MPATDWIVVDTTTDAPPPPPPDTPRTFAMVAEAVPAAFTEQFRRYSSIGQLDDDGWTGAETAYLAIAKLFAQRPTVTATSAIVMIRQTLTAEEWTIDVTGTTDGDFKLFDGAVEIATFTASTSTATDIRDGLIASAIAGYTGAIVDADTLTITRDFAGIPILLTQTSPSTNTELDVGAGPTIPSAGIYGALDATWPTAPFWGVMAPGASDLVNNEARRWVQADTTSRRTFFFGESADAGIFDPGDTDNLAVTWLAAKYTRVNLMQHVNLTDYIQASVIGRLGGSFPGSRTFHILPLSGTVTSAGISPRTVTATTALKTRLTSYTERWYGPEQDLLVLNGRMPDGQFIFQRWAEDWAWYVLRITVTEALKANAGVNLDAAGLQGVVDLCYTALAPLVTNDVIAPDYVITHVPLAYVPPGELAIGDFKTTGAILASITITPKLAALRVSVSISLV